jgi:hypothetical protein
MNKSNETNAQIAAAFAATAAKYFQHADKCLSGLAGRFYLEKALRFQRFAAVAAERAARERGDS